MSGVNQEMSRSTVNLLAAAAFIIVSLACLARPSAGPEAPLTRPVRTDVSGRPLPEALAAVTRETGVRVVMEIPEQPPRMPATGAGRTAGEVLDELAAASGRTRLERGGVVVLRPDQYPATDESEHRYREAMAGVADFIGALPVDKRAAAMDEEWLDVKQLSAEQQRRVQAVLVANSYSAGDWTSLLSQVEVAVGFLFDPYVEVDGIEGQPAKRVFIRAGERFREFDRIAPGSVPGTLRGALEEGE